MNVFVRTVWHLLAIVGLLTIAGVAWLANQGVGTRRDPPAIEAAVARTARHFAIPSRARGTRNPTTATPAIVAEARAHWADHCAACHANSGAGDTDMGRSLYPRAPDMRLPATQSLSDGELFYLIEQGVKLTGMPAWSTGTPEGEQASWHLVHFIRRLPALTPDDLAEMDALTPISADAWRAREEERRFLAGEPPLSGDLRLGSSDTDHSRHGKPDQ